MEAEETMEPNPPSVLLHERFHARARETPERVALHEGERSVTFGGLRDQVHRVAGSLRARGIGADGLVGLHMERSVEWVAAVLGVLEAGAAVVPLPPSYPEAHLRRVLEVARLDAVIADAGGVGWAQDPVPASTSRRPMPVLRHSELLAGESASDRVTADPPASDGLRGRSPDPNRPAFVLGSSGSTGRPKLIVRSHRSFFHRLSWTWARHPFTDGELGCQKAHMTTTHAVYELFEPLLAGAPVLLVPDDEARDLERFWRTVRDRGVSRLLVVPSALRASLDMPGFRAPRLEVVVLMGEYLPPDLAARAVEAFPEPTSLYSIYGSTEASSTLVVDLHAARGAHDRSGDELPLGTPLQPEIGVHVLGSDLQPVAEGETGRLHIEGPPLFTAYLGDPGRTQSVLVEPPTGGGPWYDTHDRVRRMPDGSLHFAGRADDMVKIRGFPVDLPDVERALLEHGEVRQAVVVVDRGAGGVDGDAVLIGFYTPASAPREAIYEALRARLPTHMVPSVLIGRDDLPRTRSAKVDRLRLVEEYRLRTPEPALEAGLTATGRRVADIWERTLGHRRFGPDSSFFEVGGTSLTVFALVHRLREGFGLDRAQLTGPSLYRHPTLAGQAEFVDDIGAGRTVAADAGTSAPLLVTLRGATDPHLPPLFVIASAGGTLGAYEKLTAALATPRAVIGVRDPYLWNARDAAEGFTAWVERYLDAIRERQPDGPYHLCAYSSAGAFGWEIACRLRARGHEVALLAMLDPLALDRRHRWRFGYWALRATWMRSSFRAVVRAGGRLRAPAVRAMEALRLGRGWRDYAPSGEPVRGLAASVIRNRDHLMNLAALLELNTDLPFALGPEDFADLPPDRYLGVLQNRVAELTPDVDLETIERLVVQYELQVRTQHAYEMRPYDGRVLLVEPASPYAGLVATLLAPYTRDLSTRVVKPDPPSERIRQVTARFGGLATHFRSMRDDGYVRGLARELDAALS